MLINAARADGHPDPVVNLSKAVFRPSSQATFPLVGRTDTKPEPHHASVATEQAKLYPGQCSRLPHEWHTTNNTAAPTVSHIESINIDWLNYNHAE